MPCTKCSSDFNLFNWKIKCGECDGKYCNKCLRKRDGVLYCEKCIILLKRPPDRVKLMELKPKDLQDYLRKHNISTHGLVEKHELVELFIRKSVPVKPKRGTEKLTANFAGSVPNLRPVNDLLGNLESSFLFDSSRRTNRQNNATRSNHSTPTTPRPSPTSPVGSFNQTYTPQNQQNNSPEDEQSNRSQNEQTSPSGLSNLQETFPTPGSSPLPRKYPKLSDFDAVEDLANLSAKELKILLTLNRVDYKGCCEKSELLERAERLWSDHKKAKEEGLTDNTEDLCKLCMDAPLDCVLLECGHIATCIDCGKKLAECPICRQYVIRVVRTFKA